MIDNIHICILYSMCVFVCLSVSLSVCVFRIGPKCLSSKSDQEDSRGVLECFRGINLTNSL